MVSDSLDTLDQLDLQLAHALQLDGRASFSAIAGVLGVSDQTVARRYRRLRSTDALRVVGAVNGPAFGHAYWLVRLRCTPDSAAGVAAALARREDTSWVHLLSGGTEITCGVHSWTPEERDTLLLQKLPRTGRVVSVSAHLALHVFRGPPDSRRLDALSTEQVAALRPAASPAPATPVVLDATDRPLFQALAGDGRTSYADLAAVLGWSESTVRRRTEQLLAGGALYFNLEVDPARFGLNACARLWISVPPSDLTTVGETIAQHHEVVFVAATTGTANLVAVAACHDTSDLYRYLTERIGTLRAIREIETAPVIRTVKRAGAVLAGQR